MVVAFSICLFVNAQDEVEAATEITGEATNDVEDATAGDKAAEIKEIDEVEKAQEAETEKVNKEIDKTAEAAEDEVKKDMAEDKVAAEEDVAEAKKKAEAELAEKPEADEKSSSWLSWLWPFGDDEDEDAELAENTEEVAEAVPAEEATEKEPEVAVEAPVEEPAVVAEAPVEEPVVEEITEEVTEEPEVAVEADPAEEAEESSFFGWLWPFGGDDDVAEVDVEETVAEEMPAEEPVVEEEAVTVVAEEPVVEEEAAPAEEPVVAEEEADDGEKIDYAHKALFYFPNLLIDFTDIFSVTLGVGAESGLRIGATQWFQLGGNYGDTYFVEKGYKRQIGGGYNNGYIFQLGPLVKEKRYVDETFGSIEEYIIKDNNPIISQPTDDIYAKKVRDFWEIGVEGGWLLKFDFQMHPIEFADFFTGLIFIDICEDDKF